MNTKAASDSSNGRSTSTPQAESSLGQVAQFDMSSDDSLSSDGSHTMLSSVAKAVAYFGTSAESASANRNEDDPFLGWTPSQFKPTDYARIHELRDEPSNSSASADRKSHNVREYTLGEEIANSVTHGLGALLAVAAIPILVVLAVGKGGGIYLFAALVYTITMLVEYTMSTLYHAIAHEKAKRVFKVLDHSCIYLFIAGSYTPFCLIALSASGGMWLCVFVWVVALAGVACEAFWVFRPRWVSAVLYLLLGWSVVWFLPPLMENMLAPGLWLLVGGGLCYSVGCVFYVLKKIPYMHSIFHLWVLAGSILQFLAIALYIM